MFYLCPCLSHKSKTKLLCYCLDQLFSRAKPKCYGFNPSVQFLFSHSFLLLSTVSAENQYLKLLKRIFMKEKYLVGSIVEFLAAGHDLKFEQLMTFSHILLEPHFPMSPSLCSFNHVCKLSQCHLRTTQKIKSSVFLSSKTSTWQEARTQSYDQCSEDSVHYFQRVFDFVLYERSRNRILLHAHAAAYCSFTERAHRVADPANCTEPACVASVRWFDRSDMQLNEIGKDMAVDCQSISLLQQLVLLRSPLMGSQQ